MLRCPTVQDYRCPQLEERYGADLWLPIHPCKGQSALPDRRTSFYPNRAENHPDQDGGMVGSR